MKGDKLTRRKRGQELGKQGGTRMMMEGEFFCFCTHVLVQKETGQHTVLSADSSLPSCASAYNTIAQ